MRLRHPASLHALLLLVPTLLCGCTEQSVGKFNAAPEAVISSHEAGAPAEEGELITLWGVASDPDDDTMDLVASWYRVDEVICPSSTPASDGATSCEMSFSPEAATAILVVQDPANLAGQDEVSFTVDANAVPEASIVSPESGGVYYSDQKVTFQGMVSDEEDLPDALLVRWTSDLDGELDVESEPDSAGQVLGYAYLSEGEHAITLEVTDSAGRSGTSGVVIDVGPPNSPPSCEILAPDGTLPFALDSAVTFEGLVGDGESSPALLDVTWTSDWDGLLATSTADAEGNVRFTTSSLSANTHTITLEAIDPLGLGCSDSLELLVGVPPALSVSSPSDGSSFSEEDLVLFEASVDDAEDEPSSLSLRWVLDGSLLLDEASPDSGGRRAFSTDEIEVGRHDLRVSAIDTDGFEAFVNLVFTITSCEALWYRDADGDTYGDASDTTTGCAPPRGYVADATDCDDSRAAVHPGATEYCNDLDDDCDSTVDESDASGAPTWYADTDSDDFGDPDSTRVACEPPSGYVANDDDCDDRRALSNPEATEYCNGFDDDCNGATDESSASDALVWHLDADDDGYGVSSPTIRACTLPLGYSANATDCDDTRDTVYPGASESCNLIDDDCDTEIDEMPASGASTWYLDADSDGYGLSTSTTSACSLPSGYASRGGDCDDAHAEALPGGTETCDELDNDCDGSVDEGVLLTWYRDSDRDGFGNASSTSSACTRPSGYVSNDDDCDDIRATRYPGNPELCDSIDNDCDLTVDEGTSCYDDDDDGFTEDEGDCDDSDADVSPDGVEVCNGIDDNCDDEIDEAFGSWSFNEGVGSSVMRLNGSAEQIWYDADGYIELTDTALYEVGSAFFVDRIPGDTWYVSFQVWIGGGTGADGLAFAFLDETDPTICGDGGGELAVSGFDGYAVELDVFQNTWDPNGNHLALVDTRSFSHLSTATAIPTLENTGDHTVEVWYESGAVRVELDGTSWISTTVSTYDPDAWLMGFSSSTGDYHNWHIVDDVFIGCP